MELMNENGDWAGLDPVLLEARLADGRQARRREAGERRRQSVLARRARTELQRAEAADRRHIRQTKKAMRDLGLLAPIRAFGPRIRVRAESRQHVFSAVSPKVARRQARPVPIVRKLKTGRPAIIDLKGRESVFIKFTYLGLKSIGWAPGKAAAHARYVHEHDRQWGLFPLSNMGQSIDEIAACWDAIEAIEQEYRANAKIQLRAVGYLPTDLSFEQMRQMVQAMGEREFGAVGLPWSAAIHPPKPGQNNWHFHIDASMRPFARVGEHDWVFASEKINGIDNPAGLKELRGRMCGHLNYALCKAKSTRRYTHLKYSERGIKGARRQQHLGPERAAAAATGEQVAMAVRNVEQAEVNWAAYQRYLAEAQLQAADLDLRKARLKVEAAVADRTLATIRDIVIAANSLIKVSHPERATTSVETLRQYVDIARCIERIAVNMASVPPINLDSLGLTIDHARRCERLGLEMAHGATSKQTAALDSLATSIALASKLVGIDVRSHEPKTTDLHQALAHVRSLQAINIAISPTALEMAREYRLVAAKIRAQETTGTSSVDGSCGVLPTSIAPRDVDNPANALPALKDSAAFGAPVSKYELATCAALGVPQLPTRNALIDAANAFVKWVRDDSVSFNQHFMMWRDSMSDLPSVRAWNEACNAASNVGSDGDVRSRAKALLRDEQSMARIRTQAPLLEIAVRLCIAGDPEQFEPQLGLNSQHRGISSLAPVVESTTIARSSPVLDGEPAPVVQTDDRPADVVPTPAIAMPLPSSLADGDERRQSRTGASPPPPKVMAPTPGAPPKSAAAIGNTADDTIGPFGDTVLALLRSSSSPTPELLSEASKMLRVWVMQDPQAVNAYIATLFARMSSVTDVNIWSTVRKQPASTDREAKLARVTKMILANHKVMVQVRSHAPLLELLIFQDQQRSMARQVAARSHAVEKTRHSGERAEEPQTSAVTAPSPEHTKETIPREHLYRPNPYSDAKAAVGAQEPGAVPSALPPASIPPTPVGTSYQPKQLGRVERGAAQPVIKPGNGKDLAWAHKIVKGGSAVAIYHDRRLKIIRMHAGAADHLAVAPGDVAAAQAIAKNSRPVVHVVERMCKVGQLFIDSAGRLDGDGSVSAAFIAFSQRILEEEAFRLGVITALDAGRKVAAEQREKAERDRLRQPRSTGSTANQPHPTPPLLRPVKLGMKDGRPSTLTDLQSQIEHKLSMDRGLSRTED